MKKIVLYSAIGLFFISCKPKISIIYHDEDMAADRALEFAQVAFVQKDYAKAYLLLSRDAKTPFRKFESVIGEIHPNRFPNVIRAVEFEPMPGQKAMNIFLYGENAGEEFYYRVVMEGTKETDYRVFDFYRGNGPYPPSKLRRGLKGDREN